MGAAAILAVGCCFSLAAAGSDLVRRSVESATSGSGDAVRNRVSSAVAIAILAVALVLLVFFVTSYVLIRSARRFRMAAERKRPAPTPSEDVWKQHKLPENWDEERDVDEDGSAPVG